MADAPGGPGWGDNDPKKRTGILADIIDRAAEAIIVSDANRRPLLWNRAFCELTGYGDDELRNMVSAAQLTAPEWRLAEENEIAELDRTGKPRRYENEYLRKDGTRVPVEILRHIMPGSDRNAGYYYSFVTDISERKQREETIRHLASFPEINPNPIIEIDAEGRLPYTNPAAEGTFLDLLSLGGEHPLLIGWRDLLKQATGRGDILMREVTAGGRTWEQAVFMVPDKNSLRFYHRDITDRKLNEKKLQHLNRVLRGIRNINQLITREKNVDRLILGACQSLIEARGFEFAWIALLKDGKATRVAEAGLGEMIKPLRDLMEKGELPACTRQALATPEALVVEGSADCSSCPLAECRKGRQTMCRRIEQDGKVFGVMATTVSNETVIDAEERDLMAEAVGDLGFALAGIEAEDQRKRMEESLRESEERYRVLFQAMVEGFALCQMIYDETGKPIDFRYLDVNPAFARLTGIPVEQAVGKTVREVIPGIENSWVEDYDRVVKSGRSERIVNPVAALGRYYEAYAWRHSPGRFAVVFTDITERQQKAETIRHLASFPEQSPIPIIEVDDRGIVTYENPAAAGAFPDLAGPGKAQRPVAGLARLAAEVTGHGGEMVREITIGGRVWEQTIFAVPGTKLIRIYSRNMTGKKRDEARLRHLNQILRGIRNINRLITREKDADRLMQAACEGLVETRGFEFAWIAPLREGRAARVVEAGLGKAVRSLQQMLEKGEMPFCTQQALAVPEPVVIEDRTVCRSCPVVECREGRQTMCRRLEHAGKIFGVICTTVSSEMLIDAEEREMLAEAADDIAFALASIEADGLRKQAEKALRESEERYRAIEVTAIDAVVSWGADGLIVSFNPAAERMYGYKASEAVDKPVGMLLNESLRKRDETLRKKVVEQGRLERKGLPFEASAVRKDGTEFPIETSIAMAMVDNRPLFISLTRDITGRKQLEAEQVKREKLESLGLLAGGLAHDFNNILGLIMGDVSLAVREKDRKKREELLIGAEDGCRRAAGLTRQLLTFSRGGAPVRNLTDVGSLVKETCRFTARGSNVSCEVSVAADLAPAEVDAGQISQVVSNLVINAVESMPGGGVIEVEARNSTAAATRLISLTHGRNYIELVVRDHGVGIPEDHLTRMFEPYFSTKQRGSGLGLATSYSIVKSHGGDITVESEVGSGTTVRVYLPAAGGKVVEVKHRSTKVKKTTVKGRVLVMDDEETIRLMLGKMLSNLGYKAEMTGDGVEALESYIRATREGRPFQAVVLDLTVPGGMGGKEVMTKLLEIDPGVKAIVSSGYATDPIMANFGDYGFKGVVMKPYTLSQLDEVLGDVLRARRRKS